MPHRSRSHRKAPPDRPHPPLRLARLTGIAVSHSTLRFLIPYIQKTEASAENKPSVIFQSFVSCGPSLGRPFVFLMDSSLIRCGGVHFDYVSQDFCHSVLWAFRKPVGCGRRILCGGGDCGWDATPSSTTNAETQGFAGGCVGSHRQGSGKSEDHHSEGHSYRTSTISRASRAAGIDC